MALLLRFFNPDLGVRLGVRMNDTIHDITDVYPSLTEWLRQSRGKPQTAIDELLLVARRSRRVFAAAVIDAPPLPNLPALLPPVDAQDVWASRVTCAQNSSTRTDLPVELPDSDAHILRAERPVIFFKAQARHVAGPYGLIGVRSDSTSCVPEPGLALLLNPALEVVGCGIGIDMTARDIEAESPLYLPQAKIFPAACALGPGFLLGGQRSLPHVVIQLSIERGGSSVYEASANTGSIRQDFPILAAHLERCGNFDEGVILLTTARILSPYDFTVQSGDMVQVTINSIGRLTMTAALV